MHLFSGHSLVFCLFIYLIIFQVILFFGLFLPKLHKTLFKIIINIYLKSCYKYVILRTFFWSFSCVFWFVFFKFYLFI